MNSLPDIQADVIKLLEPKRRKWPCHSNRSSMLGDPCVRRLVYERTRWEEKTTIDETIAGIFQTGDELEAVVLRILSQAGQLATPAWRVVAGQRAIDDALFKRYQITGTPDGILQIQDGDRWRDVAVVDIKTANEFLFRGINSVDDLTNGHVYQQRYRHQLHLYALGLSLEQCALILVNKGNIFEMKMITFGLDLDNAENLLSKAEAVNDHIEAGTLPEKINKPRICRRCPFEHICNPDLVFDAGAVISDPELERLLDERRRLEDDKRRAKAVDDELREALPEGELIIIGKHVVKAKRVTPKSGEPYWRRTYEYGNGKDNT